LGGRLDAVNVFDNDCAVVTSVDIDHTDYLGDTREKIAFEKAGIFRVGKVAICADAEVPQTLPDHAVNIGAKLWCIGREFSFAENRVSLPAVEKNDGVNKNQTRTILFSQAHTVDDTQKNHHREQQQWNFHGPSGARNSLPYPALRGAFQLYNASAALAALDAMKDRLPVSMQAVRRGLIEVELSGRFQVLPGSPQIILDVAHNPHAAHSLAKNLANLPAGHKTFAVFAMLKDKDRQGVVQALKDQIDVWLVAGIDAPRGATAAEMAEVLAAEVITEAVLMFSSIENAFQHACNQASENDRIAVFGSFYTVAEVMRVRGLRAS